jgi:phosphocarrier protein
MKVLTVEIKNEAGLHARPSSKFVGVTSKYDSDITVHTENESVNGKSIMGLMLLGAEKGKRLKLVANGVDEHQLLEALRQLVEEEKFNEE